jgi:hypothetical protein
MRNVLADLALEVSIQTACGITLSRVLPGSCRFMR